MIGNGFPEDYTTFAHQGDEDIMEHVYDFSQPNSLSDELGMYQGSYGAEGDFLHKPKLPSLSIPPNPHHTVGLGFSPTLSPSSPYPDYGLQASGHGSPMSFLMPPLMPSGGTPSSVMWRDMPLTPGSGLLLRHPLPMSANSSPFFSSGSPLGLSPDLCSLTLTNESHSDTSSKAANSQSSSEQEPLAEALLLPNAQLQHPGQTFQTPDLDEFLGLYSFPTSGPGGSSGQSSEAGGSSDFSSASSRLDANIPITVMGDSQSMPLQIQTPGQYSSSLRHADGDYINVPTTQSSYSFMASPSMQHGNLSQDNASNIHADAPRSGPSRLSTIDPPSLFTSTIKGVVHDLSLEKSKSSIYGGVKKLQGASKKMLHAVEGKRKKEQKFVCKICGQRVTSKQNLENHLNSHLGNKPFACTFCTKLYGHARSLNRHLLKDHDYSAREAKRRQL